MTRVSISQYEFNNLVEDGIDLIAYFEGRFDEALYRGDLPETAFIPKLETDLLIDGQKLAEMETKVDYLMTTHVEKYETENLKSRVTALEQQVTELKSTNEAVFKRLCLLENRDNDEPATATGASGRVYRVGDVLIVPKWGTGTVVDVDPDDPAMPVNIAFDDSVSWVHDVELNDAFKLEKN